MRELCEKIAKEIKVNPKTVKHIEKGVLFRREEKKKDLHQLAQFLYTTYYSGEADQATYQNEFEFLNGLRKIEKGATYIEKGWAVKKVIGKGVCKVIKDGVTLIADINEQIDGEIQEGSEVGVRFSCHYPNVSPGYYLFNSREGSLRPNEAFTRIYFSPQFESALDFVEWILRKLNEAKVVYQFKILNQLEISNRKDAAVLYFHDQDLEKIIEIVEEACQNDWFRPETSSFYKMLHPGVGVAQHPDHCPEKSYGMYACEEIANVFLQEKKVTGEILALALEKVFGGELQPAISRNIKETIHIIYRSQLSSSL